MAEKKSKSKTATAAKKSVSKPAAAKSAAAKAPPAKSAPSKPITSKPIALQTVARKPAKSQSKATKTIAKRAALNGRPQSAAQRPRASDTATFYFIAGQVDARISVQKPSDAAGASLSGSFDEVKDKAVDHLIELVDMLERRLWEIKRAQDFASYQALTEGE